MLDDGQRSPAWVARAQPRPSEPSELLERLLRERRAFELALLHRRPRDVWRRLRFIVEQARIWAKKLANISDMNERVRQMHLAAFGRPPEPAELQEALAFVESQSKTYGAAPNDERVWADLGHVLFNVKTFIYLN